MTAGQKAIGYYKQRSQVNRGPTGHIYPRMVHFINYHLSELLHYKNDEIIKSEGEASQSIVSLPERQKMRR